MVNELRKIEDTYERIKFLKDKFLDQTVYITTPGPSLLSHDRNKLIEKLKGKPVIALKQSYNYVKEVATFHGMSAYGYQPYEYYSDDTIVHWQLTAMNMPYEVDRIQNEWKHRADILIPCYSTPWIDMNKTTAFSRNFDNFLAYSKGKAIWGPGIMYETGIPLALHLGAKEIVTVGWDIGDLSKFEAKDGYKLGDDNWRKEHAEDLYADGVHAGAGPDYRELKETIACTKEMYDWFLEKGIKVRILSDINPADERFERITLDEL
tara:strand:+ start:1404 stop:2195 length:792 start_codon:yes stop_codon:yes gene_type:complete